MAEDIQRGAAHRGKAVERGASDAKFRFALSEDSMKLGISRYFPPGKLGAQPTTEMLRRQILDAGVKLPPDEDALKKVIKNLEDNKDITGIALVRGVEVQEPEDAKLVPLGDLSFPVFPGDEFYRYEPPKEARAGETIDGVVSEPKSRRTPSDISIEVGENCAFNNLNRTYVSRVYGIGKFEGGRVRVSPRVRVSQDEIRVVGTLYHKDYNGRGISAERIGVLLQNMDIKLELDEKAIENLIIKASRSGVPQQDVVLVQGKHPVHGQDGWLEYLVSTREATGTEDKSGRLNFKDRGSYPAVQPGQTIARLHPPTRGKAGIDVYGKMIPANEGKEVIIRAGENVESEDGILFKAKDEGIMVVDGAVLHITDCLVINRDIDLSSGNVHVEKGSVMIKGSVLAGFEVKAPKNVIVHGSVESSNVTAGESIEIHGGILQPDGGKVVAPGTIKANYMNNARVEAGGDVFVKNEVNNSHIQARGKVYALEGKGIIQGGIVISSGGVECKELGTELGVTTTISLALDSDTDRKAIAERALVQKEIEKIDGALGGGDPRAILERTPPEKREMIAKIIKHRIGLAKKYKDINDSIVANALKRQKELSRLQIKVLHRIHPGVVFRIAGKTAQVKRPIDRSMVYWSHREQRIVFGTL